MISSVIHIRTATTADAEQIARVHIDSWRTTYHGIVPDEYLDKINLEARANYWRKELTRQSDHVFVAENEGIIVGFAAAGENRDGNQWDAELYAIYVLEQHQQNNIGRLLLTATTKYVQACGHSSMYVWVLADNNAKQFYERMGGERVAEKEIEISGRKLTEVAYAWRDLNRLTTTP